MQLNTSRVNQLSKLEKKLGLKFKDLELLHQAFIHPSYSNEKNISTNNQRLEFLGDAVLELAVTKHLFSNHQGLSEGMMSRIRARVVCETSLAKIAETLILSELLYLGKGEDATGGRKKPSILADTFEALVGAVFVDRGFKIANDFVIDNLIEIIKSATEEDTLMDYKTALQEKLQGISQEPIIYKVIDESGPDHSKTFQVNVIWKGKVIGKGKGNNKKQAEQRAAKLALNKV